ncbi:Ppx/GppA phosphatase family protein [Alicyclobacillus fastidiosus]|uniref:Ppx/GppA phosphatase family protein n=1 Tax=Alicyclobacillus fastidiosus TaxID=392011 RepID=A0ABV5AJ49_9BACL|nr:Ppx/GppA phosphatase family protein [Alicyclobacillus fastidiosus]WEH11583.1 Ppx/GppA phosphatase family protein [Alicyclobacillus fastidiosus]
MIENPEIVVLNMRVGIIDLGSNSARLAVYEINGNGGYRPCCRMKKNIQLAQYIDGQGNISSSGIHQAVVSVQAFKNAGELYHVEHWAAAGTAAIRLAKNRTEVMRVLEQETGICFRVLSGEEEAWYGYLGVINTTEVKDAILVDIGGASTEIAHIRNRDFVNAISLPYGALTLSTKFAHLETPSQTEAIFQFIKSEMFKIPWLNQLSNLPVIGTGGTARAIGKIFNQTHQSKINRVDGTVVPRAVLEQIYEKIKSKNVKERKKLGKLSDSRAHIIHAGIAAIRALTSLTFADTFLVSGNGLREGLFYEYLFRDSTSSILHSVKEHSIHNLIRLFDIPIEATYRVADLADQLFEQLATIHELNSKHRDLMRSAVLLEMIGTFVNVEHYKEHTDYLIRSSHLQGFSQEEMLDISRVIIGNGQKPFKQLNLMMQLAKTLVYEAQANNANTTLHKGKNELTITCSTESEYKLTGTLESMSKDFFKQFGIGLRGVSACH